MVNILFYWLKKFNREKLKATNILKNIIKKLVKNMVITSIKKKYLYKINGIYMKTIRNIKMLK